MGFIVVAVGLFIWLVIYAIQVATKPDLSITNNKALEKIALENKEKISVFLNQSISTSNQLTKRNFLVIDIETTGLPKSYNAAIKESDNWPFIVSISAVLYNENEKMIEDYYTYIKQLNPIPAEAINIHGISTEIANSEGVLINSALIKLIDLSKKSNYLIAHNIDFDYKIIQAEFYRNAFKNPFTKHKKICTMKKSKAFVGAYNSSFTRIKYPKLSELVYECYGVEIKNLHNAKIDCKVAAACFFYLKNTLVIDID